MPAGRSGTERKSPRGGRTGADATASAPTDAVAEADTASPAAADPAAARTDVPAGETDAETTERVPLNRAERRAHSRGKPLSAPAEKGGKVTVQKGPVQGPRMWANRRSG